MLLGGGDAVIFYMASFHPAAIPPQCLPLPSIPLFQGMKNYNTFVAPYFDVLCVLNALQGS